MLENTTQVIVNLLTIAAAVGTGYMFLYSKLKGLIEKSIATMLKPITDSIADVSTRIDRVDDNLNERMDRVDSEINKRMNKVDNEINKRMDKVALESCKNYLVRCLSDLEKGEELSEAAKIRYGEQYDYYINHGENSYIKSGTEKYRAEGKL